MRIFYQRNKEARKIEQYIQGKIDEFIEKIKRNKLFNYIEVFGLTGPAARGQATIHGSDIDFYTITKSINPLKEAKLRRIFEEIFHSNIVETSLLTASPTIYKKPDLMFYEFIHSGGFLLGRPKISKNELNIEKIPRWEGVRLLTYRIDPFINTFRVAKRGIEIKTDKPDYYYSKVIQGIGEAFLLLEDEYKADNFERLKAIRKSKYAKQLGIIKEFEKAQEYRYKGKPIGRNSRLLYNRAISISRKALVLYLQEYLKVESIEEIKKELRKIHPSLVTLISTRLFFIRDYYKTKKRVKLPLKIEPMIEELIWLIDLLQFLDKEKYGAKVEELRRNIVLYWKIAPRFWYWK